MDELRDFFSRIKLVRMRTPNLVKVVLIVVIVLCMGVLITLRLGVMDLQQRTENLRDEASALNDANTALDEKIQNAGSVQGVVDVARDELGLVEPGTIIYETVPAPATESSEGN